MERSKGPRETVGELEKFRGLGYLQGTRQQLFTNQFRNVDRSSGKKNKNKKIIEK